MNAKTREHQPSPPDSRRRGRVPVPREDLVSPVGLMLGDDEQEWAPAR